MSFPRTLNRSLLILLGALCIIHAQVIEKDSLALVDLYNATDGENWNAHTNWLVGPVSTWSRITVTGNRVTHIYMVANNLTGTYLPSSLGDLDSLRQLNLASNPNLAAQLPPEIGNLTKLENLDVALCDMYGPIPAELGNLTRILQLKLNNNNFSGTIPEGLGNMRDAYYFNLSNNALTGTIPATIWNLDSLGWFEVAHNDLEGIIPEDITGLHKLENILLSGNRFTDFPDISSLTNIVFLDLDNNRFTFEDLEPNMNVASHRYLYAPQDSIGEAGSDTLDVGSPYNLSVSAGGSANHYQWMKNGLLLTDETGSSLSIEHSTLEDAGIYHCEITNDIVGGLTLYTRPSSLKVIDYAAVKDSLALVALYEATGGAESWNYKLNWLNEPLSKGWYGVTIENNRVTRLGLAYNGLTGNLPPEFTNLDSLKIIHLSGNTLSGPLPEGFWDLKGLEEVVIDNNAFTDTLPESIGELSKLRRLTLSYNDLYGELPLSLTDLANLEQLELDNNEFSGPIPEAIGSMENLSCLNLRENELSGSIPSSIGDLDSLTVLDLYGNNLDGSLPPELGSLKKLRNLTLGYNQLTGPIPGEIYTLSALEEWSMNANPVNDSLTADIGALSNLRQVNLSYCGLTGSIPEQIGLLTSLQLLNLSGNQLYGPIPSSIGDCSALYSLSLSGNNLDGEIPESLTSLTGLMFLGLGDNEFIGSIPAGIWDLTNLGSLDLSGNNWTGNLPGEIGDLENLFFLSIRDNQFEGAVPYTINKLTKLAYFYMQNNEFTDLPSLDSLQSLSLLRTENNRLTFEDIEPNIGIPSFDFVYHPQDSIGEPVDTLLNPGESLVIKVSVGGAHNLYQWLLNGNDIEGATDSTYEITSASAADSGIYICQVTNTVATELTLYTRPVNVSVKSPVGFNPAVSGLPLSYDLQQNFPNPFNPVTHIRYQLPVRSTIKISVYDVVGQLVSILLDGEKEAGYHDITFTSHNIASGIYYYRIEAGEFVRVRKMMVLR